MVLMMTAMAATAAPQRSRRRCGFVPLPFPRSNAQPPIQPNQPQGQKRHQSPFLSVTEGARARAAAAPELNSSKSGSNRRHRTPPTSS